MRLRKILLPFAFLAASAILAAASQAPPLPAASCQTQIPYGKPVSHTNNTALICRHAYLVLSDLQAKVPVWVSYTLVPEHAIGCVERSNAFAADQSLEQDQRAAPADYAKTGYDIGHVAPDGDMSWDDTVEHESFILTNMTPQLPGLNRGIWKLLESDVRAWAYERNHTLLIYAGPIYFPETDKTIGNDHVDVPISFYKIVVDTTTNEVLAFVFPQAEGLGKDLTKMRSTVADVQKETGIAFPLPDGYTQPALLWPVSQKTFTAAKKAACGKEK
jgi:endonuclease G